MPGPTISEIGERELIRRLKLYVQLGQKDTVFGVGDDCALVTSTQPCIHVYTSDLLIEGTHFLANAQTDWAMLGHKAAAANLSDIAAMGAAPVGLLVSVGLPPSFEVDDLLDFYRGLSSLANRCDSPIIGGDTTRAGHVTISIAAIGRKAPTDAPCLRSDSRPGDHLYVSGALGSARAGLDLILDPAKRSNIDSHIATQLIQSHYMRNPRLHLGRALASQFDRVAIIDISDGLYNEATLLAEASGAQLHIDLDSIPVHDLAGQYCQQFGQDAAEFALFSGEEYELLFAVPATPDQLRDHLRKAGVDCPITHVGTVNPGSGLVLLKGGHPVDPPNQTFTHFRKEP